MAGIEPEKLRFSKKAVNRAGEVLRVNPQNEEALGVLEYWREIHAEMLGGDGQDRIRPGSISIRQSTRLKRTVSIMEKMKRHPKMRLARIQDIAGIRFVFDCTETKRIIEIFGVSFLVSVVIFLYVIV